MLYEISHLPISAFNYSLPKEAIAKYPAIPRGTSKLMIINATKIQKHLNIFKEYCSSFECSGDSALPQLTHNINRILHKSIEHKQYNDIVNYFNSGDVAVINNVKVIHARMFGVPQNKSSLVEILLLMPFNVGDYAGKKWYALIGNAKKLKNSNGIINFENGAHARVLDHLPDGRFVLEFSDPAIELAETLGEVPIPKYMHRNVEKIDEEYYQTVVAKKKGGIAAPTASLNLTKETIQEMLNKGVKVVYITLYVGWATFAPLREAEFLDEFNMPPEYVEMSQQTADIILQAKKLNKQIITFGTTATRTVEGIFNKFGTLREYKGSVELFITPGYEFRVSTGIVTNFHPPLTTPMVLVSSILGINATKAIYRLALDSGYKFYSYGDSMLIRWGV